MDSLMVAAITLSLIIRSLNEKLDNTYLTVDMYALSTNDLHRNSQKLEKFINELREYLVPSKLDEYINASTENNVTYDTSFVDMFNFVMFLKRINFIETVGADSYYRKLLAKYEVAEPAHNQSLTQIFQLKNSEINYKSIQEAMNVVNISGNFQLQKKIYMYLEMHKKQLLNLLEHARNNSLEDNVLVSKILSDARNISDKEYKNICYHDISLSFGGSIQKSIDFLKMRDPLSEMFIASDAVPEFLCDLIKCLPQKYGNILDEIINSSNLYIDTSCALIKGQTYYSPTDKKSFVYSSYDASLQSFFTLLHELGHYVSNRVYDNSKFYGRNLLEREIIADAFLFFCLRQIEENSNYNFMRVKYTGIQYYFMRPLRYILDTLLFVDNIDNWIKTNKVLTIDDYNMIYQKALEREQLGVNYNNVDVFKNNYLANSEIYENNSVIANKMIVRLTAILFADSIYGQNKDISYDIILDFYKNNSLADLLLRAYKIGGNIICNKNGNKI